MGEFVGLLPVFHEGVLGQAVGDEPELALFHPVLVPAGPAPFGLGLGEVGGVGEGLDAAAEELHRFVGLDEELELHLLELARTEDVVAGGDLVAEGLADLADAEGRGLAAGDHHVGELREDGLGRLGTEIGHVGGVVDGADDGLEHQVEGARLGHHAATGGAGEDLGFARGGGQEDEEGADVRDSLERLEDGLEVLGMLHGVEAGGDAFALALAPIRHRTRVADQGLEGGLDGRIVEDLPDLVGAHQLAAIALAHAHRVGEGVQVAGGLPDGRVHDDGGV